MKKIAIFLLMIIVILTGITYTYMKYKANYYKSQRTNYQYDSYYNQEFYAADLVTLINKAYDNNLTNKVEKDNKGKFINNNENSIKIDIKILDNEKTYEMETLYAGGMDNFIKYYNDIKFKCTKIDYHPNKQIKYMFIEQITQ